MPDRCSTCRRSLATLPVYRQRGETFRPGSIAPSSPVHARERPVLCDECYRMLSPDRKHHYAPDAREPRYRRVRHPR